MRRLLFILTAVYTVMLITRPHEFVPALVESPLLQILILAAFAAWLFTTDKGTELPQFRALPFFLMFVWLSLGAAGWWGGIVDALQRMLPPILLFVVITGCVRSLAELRTYSVIVIACACILVFHGHLQATTGIGWTGEPMIEGRITYSGIFNDPNDIGLLIVTALALTFFLWRTLSLRLVKLTMMSAAGWLLYGVYLTDSRGTMLATITVIGLAVRREYGKKVVLVLVGIAVPVLVAFTRLAALNAEEESAENRVEAWYDGVQYVISQPFTGVGWGMFGDVHGMTAHNSIVLAMAELGLPGYVFWVAFVMLSGLMIYQLGFPVIPAAAPPAPLARRRPTAAATARGRGMPRAKVQRVPARPAPVPVQQPPVQRTPVQQASAQQAGPVPQLPAAEEAERIAARYIAFGAAGFGVGAFFLSQSYKAMLFIVCGLIVGRYLGMREAGIVLPQFSLGDRLPAVVAASLASVVGMWVLVRILL